MEMLSSEADRLWQEDRGGRAICREDSQHPGIRRKSPVLTRFVVDDRIWGTVEDHLGSRFLWNGSEGNQTAHQEHCWHTPASRLPR